MPKYQKENERTRFKPKRVDKKTMVATWRDSDSSGSESKDKEIANLCVMARESSGENDECKEVTLEFFKRVFGSRSNKMCKI